MPSRKSQKPDFDSPWKEALDLFFEAFLEFFFPGIHGDMDWARGYESLDKEFRRIAKNAQVGQRFADKLFKVWEMNGRERWLLIHLEVQGNYVDDFAERMFVYNIRAFQMYNRNVVSLAVLTDDDPNWRPDHFEYGGWGSQTGITFPIVKLVDFALDSVRLEESANPFAAIVLAHLKTIETRQEPETRSQWKLRLIKGLYARNWSADQVRQVFRLIDWIMTLPAELENEFRQPFMSLRRKSECPLNTRFGQAGGKLGPKIREIQDVKSLRALQKEIWMGPSLAAVRKLLS